MIYPFAFIINDEDELKLTDIGTYAITKEEVTALKNYIKRKEYFL